ncbi:MAG TPA: M15 family metallopeptidase [Solirubrobacterales bacterium]|nr:M15 family metallopeptidase [Solirubrobacterales bacterium]
MRALFRLHYPIRQMRLVDAYGAVDDRSMDADNTSAFNCRFVAGSGGVWSQHAYGRALDLNPLENPYVTESGCVSPPAGAPYADRSRHAKGLIHRATARWSPPSPPLTGSGAATGPGPKISSTSRRRGPEPNCNRFVVFQTSNVLQFVRPSLIGTSRPDL